MASEFVAPPDVAPHATAGAVDVTLIDARERELDMGTAVNSGPIDSRNRCLTGAANISRKARRNRATLIEAMSSAGFRNLPTEWRHWSYGDKYWAAADGRPNAVYGVRDAN